MRRRRTNFSGNQQTASNNNNSTTSTNTDNLQPQNSVNISQLMIGCSSGHSWYSMSRYSMPMPVLPANIPLTYEPMPLPLSAPDSLHNPNAVPSLYNHDLTNLYDYFTNPFNNHTPPNLTTSSTINISNQLTKNHQSLDDLGFPEALIPEKFLCALTYKVMDEPVYDSKTNTRVNKSDMLIALNTNGQNPFDRQPLKPEELIADILLLDEINLFISEIKKQRLALVVGKNPSSLFSTQTNVDPIKFLQDHGNPYIILGINETSSSNEIIKAYKKLVLINHPDKNKSKDAQEKFQVLTEAKILLLDEISRTIIDNNLGIIKLSTSVSKLAL